MADRTEKCGPFFPSSNVTLIKSPNKAQHFSDQISTSEENKVAMPAHYNYQSIWRNGPKREEISNQDWFNFFLVILPVLVRKLKGCIKETRM